MAIKPGDRVRHPRDSREGLVLRVLVNPACLMRTLVVRWQDGTVEEVEELEFGPLED